MRITWKVFQAARATALARNRNDVRGNGAFTKEPEINAAWLSGVKGEDAMGGPAGRMQGPDPEGHTMGTGIHPKR